jgi:hypothetical protein
MRDLRITIRMRAWMEILLVIQACGEGALEDNLRFET